MGPARFHCATLLLTDTVFKYLTMYLTVFHWWPFMTCNVLSCLKIPSCFFEICPADFSIMVSCFKKRRVVLVQEFIKTGGFASAFVYKQRQKRAQKWSNALRMGLKTINTNHLMWQSYKIVELTD